MKHNLKTLTINFTQAELDRVKKELQEEIDIPMGKRRIGKHPKSHDIIVTMENKVYISIEEILGK